MMMMMMQEEMAAVVGGGGDDGGVDEDKQKHNTIKLEWLQCAVYDEFHHQSAVSVTASVNHSTIVSSLICP